jgi:hypothetical protein
MYIDLNAHQRYVEQTFSRKNIRARILNELNAEPSYQDVVEQSVKAVSDWLDGDYYQAKNDRLAQLANRDITKIVNDIYVETMQIEKAQLFTSVVGQIASVLGMSDKIDGTKTAGELLAVICNFDMYDIFKENKYGSMHLVSNFSLSARTKEFIQRTKYLPPMVVEPNTLTKNFDNAYLTEPSSLILGKGTHHDNDICLDSINKFNEVPLTLNTRLLTKLSERPKKAFAEPDKKEQWLRFVNDSYEVYKDLIQVGNSIWLTHKVDSRGRTYAQGYHVSTQGNEFRKAIVEFADKEVIS